MKFAKSVRLYSAALLATLIIMPAAYADSGFFVGGAYGELQYSELNSSFDQDSAPYKIMGGYIFDMPVVDIAIEAAYNDFGSQEDNSVLPSSIAAEGLSAFVVGGLDWGL